MLNIVATLSNSPFYNFCLKTVKCVYLVSALTLKAEIKFFAVKNLLDLYHLQGVWNLPHKIYLHWIDI